MNWLCVLPEDGTHVPKHVGDAHLMSVLIKTVPFVVIINGVYDDSLMFSRIRIHLLCTSCGHQCMFYSSIKLSTGSRFMCGDSWLREGWPSFCSRPVRYFFLSGTPQISNSIGTWFKAGWTWIWPRISVRFQAPVCGLVIWCLVVGIAWTLAFLNYWYMCHCFEMQFEVDCSR